MNGRSAGFTLVEVTVAMAIVAVALVGLMGAMALAVKQSALAADTALAVDAARRQGALMAAQDFRLVFALYNQPAGDDPLGAGTAPGPYFAVPGLTPRPGNPGGTVGRIEFPVSGAYGEILRENLAIADLGLPRDLDGDGVIGSGNKALRYILLPARIVLEWRGSYGDASYRVHILLAERGGL